MKKANQSFSSRSDLGGGTVEVAQLAVAEAPWRLTIAVRGKERGTRCCCPQDFQRGWKRAPARSEYAKKRGGATLRSVTLDCERCQAESKEVSGLKLRQL